MRMFTILLILVLFITACGLRRSNPLDPLGNNVIVPYEVSGIITRASTSGQLIKFYELKWIANPTGNADGYYVYRGLGYNANFTRWAEVLTNEFYESGVNPGDYYFRVSAYKYQDNGGKLEGPLSQIVWVRVPI